MDNNLPKNGVFSRSTQLYLTLENISIKQLILKQLQGTIVSYQTENCISQNPNQVLSSLSDKLILQDSSNLDSGDSLIYCSAIASPLANLFHLRSRQVAEDLVSLFTIKSQESIFPLNLKIRVVRNGLIEFAVGDRSIGWWLESVMKSGNWGIEVIGNGGDDNWFPLQYVNNRCCSLLRLGATEGLITLNDSRWQITNPNPFEYYWDQHIHYRYEPTEIKLLRQISLFIDCIGDRNSQEQKSWSLLKLSDACLQFIAACRIFGSVARNQPSLAIARLGLLSIVQSCLQRVINF